MASLMENVGDRRVRRADGSTVIAATMRPDGTVRKESRVKPGFTPPDEVAAYNAIQRVHARRGYGPPRAGPVGAKPDPVGIPGAAAPMAAASRPRTKAQRKNEARRKRKQEERLKKSQEADAAAASTPASTSAGAVKTASTAADDASAVTNGASVADHARKNSRKIKKKLRQIADIEQLEEKNADQLKKLQTKPNLLQRLSIAMAALESMEISS